MRQANQLYGTGTSWVNQQQLQQADFMRREYLSLPIDYIGMNTILNNSIIIKESVNRKLLLL